MTARPIETGRDVIGISACVDRLRDRAERALGLLGPTPSQMKPDQRRVARPIRLRHFREQRITVYEIAV